MAQDKRSLEEGYHLHFREISGSTRPEKIPFLMKMSLFCGGFDSVYRARLEGSLGADDVDKIETFLLREAEAQLARRKGSRVARLARDRALEELGRFDDAWRRSMDAVGPSIDDRREGPR